LGKVPVLLNSAGRHRRAFGKSGWKGTKKVFVYFVSPW
jgi:hypothetical protein